MTDKVTNSPALPSPPLADDNSTLSNFQGVLVREVFRELSTHAQTVNSTIDDVTTNTTDIATNTADIATLQSDLAALTLDDLTDVVITSPANGAVLTYDTGTSKWIDAAGGTVTSVATGSGLTGGPITITGTISLDAKPAFSAHKNASDQTGITSGVATQVTFSTEVFDTGSHFASDTWTPPAGLVEICAAIRVTGTIAAGSNLHIRFYKNGSEYKRAYGAAQSNLGGVTGTMIDRANGTDTYTIYAFITTTSGTATVTGGTNESYFMGAWLSP